LQWTGVWSEPAQRHFFIGRDMTSARSRGCAARKRARRTRIIDTALDAFVQMDEAGNITEWNAQAEAMFGWSRAEVIGRAVAATIVSTCLIVRAIPMDLPDSLRTGEGAIPGETLQYRGAPARGQGLHGRDRGDGAAPQQRIRLQRVHRDLTERSPPRRNCISRKSSMPSVSSPAASRHDFNKHPHRDHRHESRFLIEGVADRPELLAIGKLIDGAATRGAALTHQLLAFARRQPLQHA